MTLNNVPVPGLPDRTVVSGGPLGYDVAFDTLATAQLYVANNSPVPVATVTNVGSNPSTTPATPVPTTTSTGTPASVNVLTSTPTITGTEIALGIAAIAVLYFMFKK